MAQSEEDLQRRIVEWQQCLEKGGLKVNAGKIETMVSSKGGGEQIVIRDSQGKKLNQVERFKYLG